MCSPDSQPLHYAGCPLVTDTSLAEWNQIPYQAVADCYQSLGKQTQLSLFACPVSTDHNELMKFVHPPEKLYEYFARYGEIVECIVMKNAETGRSRGFGFVTFKDPNCVQSILSNGPHQLDDRTVSTRPLQVSQPHPLFSPDRSQVLQPEECPEKQARN